MRILAIDTSYGSGVALVDGHTVLGQASSDDPRRHTENLGLLLQEVLSQAGLADFKQAQLTAIAVGRGPAPFTGLRAGLITAQILGRSCQVPVYGACSLDVIAVQAGQELLVNPVSVANTHVLVATDARRQEVYWANYVINEVGDCMRLTDPVVQSPEDILPPFDITVAGRGGLLYPDILPLGQNMPVDVDPVALAGLVQSRVQAIAKETNPVTLAAWELDTSPLYLRRPDIHPGGSAKRVTAAL